MGGLPEGVSRQALPAALAAVGGAGDFFLAVSGAWFSYTMIRSWVAAVQRRFVDHEQWVIRHIASGQWITLMRILQGAIMMPKMMRIYGDTHAIQSTFFAISGISSWLTCLVGAEIAIGRIRAKRK